MKKNKQNDIGLCGMPVECLAHVFSFVPVKNLLIGVYRTCLYFKNVITWNKRMIGVKCKKCHKRTQEKLLKLCEFNRKDEEAAEVLRREFTLIRLSLPDFEEEIDVLEDKTERMLWITREIKDYLAKIEKRKEEKEEFVKLRKMGLFLWFGKFVCYDCIPKCDWCYKRIKDKKSYKSCDKCGRNMLCKECFIIDEEETLDCSHLYEVGRELLCTQCTGICDKCDSYMKSSVGGLHYTIGEICKNCQ